jgi:hypothetical protein
MFFGTMNHRLNWTHHPRPSAPSAVKRPPRNPRLSDARDAAPCRILPDAALPFPFPTS